jgi:hypothetical protein
MYQVPLSVWRDIAETQTLSTADMDHVFLMKQNELDAYMDKQGEQLSEQKISPSVIVAFQYLLPLLVENKAITNYIIQTQQFWLRQSLPEILTIYEAIIIAQMEWRLDEVESIQLRECLQNELDKLTPNPIIFFETKELCRLIDNISANSVDSFPSMTKIMNILIRTGYVSFEENAIKIIEAIRYKFGKKVADSIHINELQGSYIAVSHLHEGTTPKEDVIAIESIDEICPIR